MVKPELKAKLEKQQYRFSGEHSAVKICNWTKNSLKDQGVCYKEVFYGIKSHRCCQITPTVGFCQNRCIFCWREIELGEGKCEVAVSETNTKLDQPEEIVENSIKMHRKLLEGFWGNDKVNKKKLKEAWEPNQFAISLTGEPTLYPHLNDLIRILKEKGNSTFVVSNGLRPDVIRSIEAPTQLYVSLDAPDEQTFLKVDRPGVMDAWNKLMETFDALREHRLKGKGRTAIRVTLIKGLNMHDPIKYAGLIERAQPTVVEVKGYMHVGASRQRMNKEHMPKHKEVREFAKEIAKHCPYTFTDEQESSFVVLLTRDHVE